MFCNLEIKEEKKVEEVVGDITDEIVTEIKPVVNPNIANEPYNLTKIKPLKELVQ